MKFLFLALLLCFSQFPTYAQEIKPTLSGEPGGERSAMISIPCSGFVNPPTQDLEMLPLLNTIIVRQRKHGGPTQDLVRAIKSKKNALKEENQMAILRDGREVNAMNEIVPEVGLNFNGNQYDGSYPADNHIAISPNGDIVSVANSTVVYAKNGVLTYYQALEPFINKPSSWGSCDPVVLFDPGTSRFIMYIQECGKDLNNEIALLFSKTANPHDGWWVYSFKGDQSNNGYYFDYPKIAISGKDLFLSANLFDSNSSVGAMVLQLNKTAGYSGNNLNLVYYHNLAGENFTLVPVSYGMFGTYGPGIYLVATDRTGGNKISLYDITNDLDKNPQIVHHTITTTPYELAGDALQKGTNCKLDMNDCRALSGFYMDGIVHFVFHSDYGGGYGGINYNRLDVVAKTNTSSMFGYEGYDYAYPAIASFAKSSTDRSVMIGFGRSSTEFDPQIRAVHVDHDLNWSNSTYIYALWNVDCFSGENVQRWGDYTGCCRNFSSTSPSVYISGMFGNFDGGWDTRIAEVHTTGSVSFETVDLGKESTTLFPNPSQDRFSLTFSMDQESMVTITISNQQGSTVRELFQGLAGQGKNHFSFQTTSLPAGMYHVVIRDNHQILSHEKLIIQP